MRPTTLGLSMMTIVKVQIPLWTNRTDKSLCLVYDKERVHQVEQPIPPKAREAMRGDKRAFFEAHFHDKAWVINKRVPEQLW